MTGKIYDSFETKSNVIANPLLRGVSRTNHFGLYPRPQPGSAALTEARATPTDGFYSPTNFPGASGTVNWATEWNALGAEQALPSPQRRCPSRRHHRF